jgi:hypothetical protein
MHDATDIVEEVRVSDLDFIFISYDEPDCEHNWAETLRRIPWARRIHGVIGFDAAHKAAASLSRTQRLITIDGDSIPDNDILDRTLRIRAGIRNHVFSWRALNRINGLCYGNGSLKCWPRKDMLAMSTHERAHGDIGTVDFCWTIPYTHMQSCCSSTDPGGSPYQAFRSGFREGVKMTLNRGQPIEPHRLRFDLWEGAVKRLQVWCGIGADHPNGIWAIYGARCGLALMTNYPSRDYQKISDYDWFHSVYMDRINKVGGCLDSHLHGDVSYDSDRMAIQLEILRDQIIRATGIDLFLLDPHQSRLIKDLIEQPRRGYDPMIEE